MCLSEGPVKLKLKVESKSNYKQNMWRRLESCFFKPAVEETSHISALISLHLIFRLSGFPSDIHRRHKYSQWSLFTWWQSDWIRMHISPMCEEKPYWLVCWRVFRKAISNIFNIYMLFMGPLACTDCENGSGPRSLCCRCWFRKVPSWKSVHCFCTYSTPNRDLSKTQIRYQAQQLLLFFLQ